MKAANADLCPEETDIDKVANAYALRRRWASRPHNVAGSATAAGSWNNGVAPVPGQHWAPGSVGSTTHHNDGAFANTDSGKALQAFAPRVTPASEPTAGAGGVPASSTWACNGGHFPGQQGPSTWVTTTQSVLPDGWAEAWDSKSNLPYYYMTADPVNTWTTTMPQSAATSFTGSVNSWAGVANAGRVQGATGTTWGMCLKGAAGQPMSVQHSASAEYVEWRRALPYDLDTNCPADNQSFLNLMARLGLYVNEEDVDTKSDHLVLSLSRSIYGGKLEFWMKKGGKIILGQTNVQKKTALWHLLEPWTYECTERPAKRRRNGFSKVARSLVPPPSESLQCRSGW